MGTFIDAQQVQLSHKQPSLVFFCILKLISHATSVQDVIIDHFVYLVCVGDKLGPLSKWGLTWLIGKHYTFLRAYLLCSSRAPRSTCGTKNPPNLSHSLTLSLSHSLTLSLSHSLTLSLSHSLTLSLSRLLTLSLCNSHRQTRLSTNLINFPTLFYPTGERRQFPNILEDFPLSGTQGERGEHPQGRGRGALVPRRAGTNTLRLCRRHSVLWPVL